MLNNIKKNTISFKLKLGVPNGTFFFLTIFFGDVLFLPTETIQGISDSVYMPIIDSF